MQTVETVERDREGSKHRHAIFHENCFTGTIYVNHKQVSKKHSSSNRTLINFFCDIKLLKHPLVSQYLAKVVYLQILGRSTSTVLTQVAPQKETPCWVLNTFAKLHKILQSGSRIRSSCLDVLRPNCAHQIPVSQT